MYAIEYHLMSNANGWLNSVKWIGIATGLRPSWLKCQ